MRPGGGAVVAGHGPQLSQNGIPQETTEMRRFIAVVLLLLSVVLLAGCDDDGSPVISIADAHDFGDNNRALVVIMGDSITYGIDVTPYPEMLGSLVPLAIVNEGISGERAFEGADRVNEVLARYRPGYLFVLYGANDVIHSRRADRIAEDLRAIVHASKAAKTIPIVCTLTPMARARGVFDEAVKSVSHFIRAMAAEEDVLVVDLEVIFDGFDNDEDPFVMEADDLLQWDGLHPNEIGNWEIALAFADMLADIDGSVVVSQP